MVRPWPHAPSGNDRRESVMRNSHGWRTESGRSRNGWHTAVGRRYCKTILEPPKYEIQDVYRALSVIAEESDFIQSELYKNSNFIHPRNQKILYYDCTNYYFEIEDIFSRLLYAIRFGSDQILFSNRVNSASQILYDRSPKERVAKVAPYLTLDVPCVPGGRGWSCQVDRRRLHHV